MERHSFDHRGQAIIESILGTTLITLFVALITGLAIKMVRQFKHDYAGPSVNSAEANLPDLAEMLPFENKIVNFSHGSNKKNIQVLFEQGWKVDSHIKIEDQTLSILSKNGGKMIFSDHLGVKICSKNCTSN